jgi:hypothetical protein
MFRKTALAAALAALTASTAFATVEQIREIDVETDITAIGNERAAAYWANLETDLEAAILARVVDRTAEEGAKIRVLIREIALASAFEQAVSLEEAVLVGRVIVTDPKNGWNDDVYDLSVSLQNASITSGIDTPEAYRALVDAFADRVVERLN